MHKLNNFGPMKWAFRSYWKSKSIDQTAYTCTQSDQGICYSPAKSGMAHGFAAKMYKLEYLDVQADLYIHYKCLF